jgi:hypothetical protein
MLILKKKKKTSSKLPNVLVKEVDKKQNKTNPKVNRRKEIVKISAELSQIENKVIIEKNQ